MKGFPRLLVLQAELRLTEGLLITPTANTAPFCIVLREAFAMGIDFDVAGMMQCDST